MEATQFTLYFYVYIKNDKGQLLSEVSFEIMFSNISTTVFINGQRKATKPRKHTTSQPLTFEMENNFFDRLSSYYRSFGGSNGNGLTGIPIRMQQ